MIELAQITIDICALFLPSFATVVAINWVVGLFRR